MELLVPQVTRLQVSLQGAWVDRWNRNLWEGTLTCDEQFVALLLAWSRSQLRWAKSLPTTEKRLQIKFDPLPISKTEPLYQFIFSSGSGAFIGDVTGILPDLDSRPSIQIPERFETGVVLPFVNLQLVDIFDFFIVCFAKADVKVRRGYVWGLKPRFLCDLESPWDLILERGRNGTIALPTAT
jgi:hypothetical protein